MQTNVEKKVMPKVQKYLDLAMESIQNGSVPQSIQDAFKNYLKGKDIGITDIDEIPKEAMAMYYIGYCAGAQHCLKEARNDMMFLKQVMLESKKPLEVN